MRTRLEDWSAAVAMAEQGQLEIAREIIAASLAPLQGSTARKFILLAGDANLPNSAVDYAANLSARLGADVIVVAPPQGQDTRLPVQSLKERLANRLADLSAQTRRLAAVNAVGLEVTQLVHHLCTSAKGVEFALIDARIAGARELRFELPVFHIR